MKSKISVAVWLIYLVGAFIFIAGLYYFLWQITNKGLNFPPTSELLPMERWPAQDQQIFLALVYTGMAIQVACYLWWIGQGLWKFLCYLVDEFGPGRRNILYGRSHGYSRRYR